METIHDNHMQCNGFLPVERQNGMFKKISKCKLKQKSLLETREKCIEEDVNRKRVTFQQ